MRAETGTARVTGKGLPCAGALGVDGRATRRKWERDAVVPRRTDMILEVEAMRCEP